MSAAPSSAAGAAALSPAQHKAALWADEGLQVYAVIMGRVVADLPARLDSASAAREIDDHDCLRPGALEPAEQQAAPYLAKLRRDSAFTDWLLFEAAADLGGWGVLACTDATKLVLRSHLRGLLVARVPGGRTIALDWMDPVLLDAIVPLFDAASLPAFMGPLQALVAPGGDAWTTWRLALGRLDKARVAITAAGHAGGGAGR